MRTASPTVQHDLDRFSDTFGLPRTIVQIIHPNGAPPPNNSVNGAALGWAEETSLDVQWAHAIAPDARIVLVAANPAETEGVQGFPSIFNRGADGGESIFRHGAEPELCRDRAVVPFSGRRPGCPVRPSLSGSQDKPRHGVGFQRRFRHSQC